MIAVVGCHPLFSSTNRAWSWVFLLIFILSTYSFSLLKTYNCKLLDWDTELYWENKCNLYWNLSRLKFLVKLKEVSHKITTRKIILQENKDSMLSIYCFMNMIEISLTLINWACDFVVGIHGGSAKYHLDNDGRVNWYWRILIWKYHSFHFVNPRYKCLKICT